MANGKYRIKVGFAGKEEIDDFILTPCISYSKCRELKGNADAIGLKFGYWAIYIAFIRMKDGKA